MTLNCYKYELFGEFRISVFVLPCDVETCRPMSISHLCLAYITNCP